MHALAARGGVVAHIVALHTEVANEAVVKASVTDTERSRRGEERAGRAEVLVAS